MTPEIGAPGSLARPRDPGALAPVPPGPSSPWQPTPTTHMPRIMLTLLRNLPWHRVVMSAFLALCGSFHDAVALASGARLTPRYGASCRLNRNSSPQGMKVLCLPFLAGAIFASYESPVASRLLIRSNSYSWLIRKFHSKQTRAPWSKRARMVSRNGGNDRRGAVSFPGSSA